MGNKELKNTPLSTYSLLSSFPFSYPLHTRPSVILYFHSFSLSPSIHTHPQNGSQLCHHQGDLRQWKQDHKVPLLKDRSERGPCRQRRCLFVFILYYRKMTLTRIKYTWICTVGIQRNSSRLTRTNHHFLFLSILEMPQAPLSTDTSLWPQSVSPSIVRLPQQTRFKDSQQPSMKTNA